MLKTRNATDSDKGFLWKLKVASMRQYVEQVYGWDDTVQYEYFENSFHPENIKIIQVDGQDMGMYELQERDEDWFLARIEILPEFQRKGIGTKVIQGIIQEAKGTNKPLDLQVFKVNPARKLYERLGFIKVGENKIHIQMHSPNNRMPRTTASSDSVKRSGDL